MVFLRFCLPFIHDSVRTPEKHSTSELVRTRNDIYEQCLLLWSLGYMEQAFMALLGESYPSSLQNTVLSAAMTWGFAGAALEHPIRILGRLAIDVFR
jgi:hypothetical protein